MGAVEDVGDETKPKKRPPRRRARWKVLLEVVSGVAALVAIIAFAAGELPDIVARYRAATRAAKAASPRVVPPSTPAEGSRKTMRPLNTITATITFRNNSSETVELKDKHLTISQPQRGLKSIALKEISKIEYDDSLDGDERWRRPRITLKDGKPLQLEKGEWVSRTGWSGKDRDGHDIFRMPGDIKSIVFHE